MFRRQQAWCCGCNVALQGHLDRQTALVPRQPLIRRCFDGAVQHEAVLLEEARAVDRGVERSAATIPNRGIAAEWRIPALCADV